MGGIGSTHGTDKMEEAEMGEACSTHERDEIMKCKMVRHAGHIGEIQHPRQIFVSNQREKTYETMGWIHVAQTICQ